MDVRLPALRTVFAVWLAILVALPFTAPFQTFDLTVPVGAVAVEEALSTDHLADDGILAVLPVLVPPAADDLRRRAAPAPRGAVDPRHSRSTVLRL